MIRLAACLSVFLIVTNLTIKPQSASVVGIWKFTKTYDASLGAWVTPDPEAAFEVQFFDDGKLTFTYPKMKVFGIYTADTTVLPHRIVWQAALPPAKPTKKYSVYRIEGSELIIKRYPGEDRFPSDTGIETEGRRYDLIKLQRESYLGEIKTPKPSGPRPPRLDPLIVPAPSPSRTP